MSFATSDFLIETRPRRVTPGQWAGLLLLLMIVLFAWLGPLLIDIDPARQQLSRFLEAPSLAHPLGYDQLGRSMLARLAHGTRLSLSLALVSVLSAAIPGIVIGLLAAWCGGWVERVLAALADAVLALPGLLLVLLLAAFAPGGFWPLYVGISLALWVEYFRVVRAASRILLASAPVEASRLLGFGPGYIVRRHLIPALWPRLFTLMRFGLAGAVLAMSALGFVGVGLQPPTPELGVMMIELLPYYREAPWLVGAPVLVLFLTLLALLLLSPQKENA
ncbi:ABC transporter permease [Herbaspirillum rubrisubalbicans]|uniref:ABC transporter permease n=2 Tax=Herbaspirillum rubrisubalbicans TaxID=80842 RepID=A0ABX9C1K8_9BURK|nr:ABC transporter permease [Herbaspirillum rubrisubalbicans]MCP1576945.1 peptide/nickel transport system permease protein [Herbaspirillum rubrisubalbicans]QJQ00152.1 ABC transporter permease [Herbaspirillum rubrisubalbicans Os34]RAM64259.1 ABC transporter permease [Herbaspirillum rubrisubalbicans]RAN49804.1 ABC transporter permease [Herbaspirillum rubrisubalbicans]